MDVEIVEFYQLDHKPAKKILTGTMHVYVPQLNADIRGIFVYRKNNFFNFKMPSQKAFDVEENKMVTFPIFNMTDSEVHKQLFKNIREKGKKYIMEKFGIEEFKKLKKINRKK